MGVTSTGGATVTTGALVGTGVASTRLSWMVLEVKVTVLFMESLAVAVKRGADGFCKSRLGTSQRLRKSSGRSMVKSLKVPFAVGCPKNCW